MTRDGFEHAVRAAGAVLLALPLSDPYSYQYEYYYWESP